MKFKDRDDIAVTVNGRAFQLQVIATGNALAIKNCMMHCRYAQHHNGVVSCAIK